ncbi:MAG: phosphoribosyltransferase family protein [Coriobacteriales bacterium]
MALFPDREHAGQRLADALARYAGDDRAVVLALPRGGVVVGAQVARSLQLPLDVVVTRKIGAPGDPEYAIAAVDADGAVLLGDEGAASSEYVRREAVAQQAEISRRLAAYRRGRPPLDVTGRTVVLVDDGVATGLTLRAAIRYLRAHHAGRVVVAVPVAPPGTATRLRREADEVVVLAEPEAFHAVGQFYSDFSQTSDAEVVALLGHGGGSPG